MAVAAASALVVPIGVAKADRVSRPAGLLLLPFLGWMAFMTVLNAALVSLNPRRVRHEMKQSREFAHL
jgi:tryptophan-rich sensory protein